MIVLGLGGKWLVVSGKWKVESEMSALRPLLLICGLCELCVRLLMRTYVRDPDRFSAAAKVVGGAGSGRGLPRAGLIRVRERFKA